jgi:hypothetical protein
VYKRQILYQLQDFDLWVRALKRHDIECLPYATVDYRVRAGDGNLSAPTAGKATRSILEQYLILRRFFDGCPPDLFREAFADRLRHPDDLSPSALACEQALLYLDADRPLNRLIGVERLDALFRDPDAARLLAGRYGLTPAEFAGRLRHVDVLSLFPPLDTALFLDTGDGFSEAQKCVAQTRLGEPEFHLEFDLRPYPGLCGLRWDPVVLRFCRLRLDEVALHEGDTVRTLDPAALTTNGRPMSDGRYEFETAVPTVFLPVDGRPDRLTIRGRLEVFDTEIALSRQYADIARLEQDARTREHTVQLRQHELKVSEHRLAVCEDRLRVREHELEVRGQQLDAHRHELHVLQAALQAHREALAGLQYDFHALRRELQAIHDSRGYRLLQKARSAARFVSGRKAG